MARNSQGNSVVKKDLKFMKKSICHCLTDLFLLLLKKVSNFDILATYLKLAIFQMIYLRLDHCVLCKVQGAVHLQQQ